MSEDEEELLCALNFVAKSLDGHHSVNQFYDHGHLVSRVVSAISHPPTLLQGKHYLFECPSQRQALSIIHTMLVFGEPAHLEGYLLYLLPESLMTLLKAGCSPATKIRLISSMNRLVEMAPIDEDPLGWEYVKEVLGHAKNDLVKMTIIDTVLDLLASWMKAYANPECYDHVLPFLFQVIQYGSPDDSARDMIRLEALRLLAFLPPSHTLDIIAGDQEFLRCAFKLFRGRLGSFVIQILDSLSSTHNAPHSQALLDAGFIEFVCEQIRKGPDRMRTVLVIIINNIIVDGTELNQRVYDSDIPMTILEHCVAFDGDEVLLEDSAWLLIEFIDLILTDESFVEKAIELQIPIFFVNYLNHHVMVRSIINDERTLAVIIDVLIEILSHEPRSVMKSLAKVDRKLVCALTKLAAHSNFDVSHAAQSLHQYLKSFLYLLKSL